MHTFLWYDYETFGVNAQRDRPAQFAAIRTDAELNEIGAPIMLYCQPAPDYLPDPTACLITGITPQLCLERGVPEPAFAAAIEAAMAEPGTITAGFNTIRFDDEVTRFMFWRNLIDPYAREWQNGCGRWDLLDVVRLTYALRPDGIQWPTDAQGKPTFKLENLTRANHIAHDSAHDALSDVRATIGLARLIRQHQPRLFDFALALHKKERVASELGLPTSPATARPFLHVSSKFPAEKGCLAVMWPLASHPVNKNELIAWNLEFDPSELVNLDPSSISQRLFTRTDALPPGVQRLPIKTIHLNKSPMVVANLRTLSPAMAQRWGVNLERINQHAELARTLPDLSATWAEVFGNRQKANQASEPRDVDQDLYGNFIGREDRRRLDQLRQRHPADWVQDNLHRFDDARLVELVWRYRGRNATDALSPEEQQKWELHRQAVLIDGKGGGLNFDALFELLDKLGEEADERSQAILEALYDYAEHIAPELD